MPHVEVAKLNVSFESQSVSVVKVSVVLAVLILIIIQITSSKNYFFTKKSSY